LNHIIRERSCWIERQRNVKGKNRHINNTCINRSRCRWTTGTKARVPVFVTGRTKRHNTTATSRVPGYGRYYYQGGWEGGSQQLRRPGWVSGIHLPPD